MNTVELLKCLFHLENCTNEAQMVSIIFEEYTKAKVEAEIYKDFYNKYTKPQMSTLVMDKFNIP